MLGYVYNAAFWTATLDPDYVDPTIRGKEKKEIWTEANKIADVEVAKYKFVPLLDTDDISTMYLIEYRNIVLYK